MIAIKNILVPIDLGEPSRRALAVAVELPDLVVMGTRGRHGIERALLGSVTEKIVRLSPAPVLTMRTRDVE
jgi:nucleotide-binding universal stress UspA family protein